MRKNLLLLTLCLSLAYSCSTDFDINAPWKEITAVYGLLDASASTQYVRVNKAFLGDGDALQFAQIADSSYHNPPPEVTLYRLNSGGSTLQTIAMQRVNAADEGIVKDEGIFASSPYYLYRTTTPISTTTSSDKYQLVVATGDQTLTSETSITRDFSVIRPTTDIPFTMEPNFEFRWKNEANAAYYDVNLIVFYKEDRYADDGSIYTEDKYAVWNVLRGLPASSSGSVMTYTVNKDSFVEFLLSEIPAPDDRVFIRRLRWVNVEFWVGGESLRNYSQVSIAQSGITSSQAINQYTNIENGIGVFGSRYRKFVEGVGIKGSFVNALACTEATKNLKIATDINHPRYPYCN